MYQSDNHYGTYRGRRLIDLVCTAAFNRFGVKLGFTIVGGTDTDMDYYLICDHKVKAATRNSLRSYVEGMAEAYRAL